MHPRRWLYVMAGIWLASARVASADVFRIDQSVLEPAANGAVTIGHAPGGFCCYVTTQVFTAGVTAPLAAISVDIQGLQGAPLRLAITPVLGAPGGIGLPDLSTVLAEMFIPGGSASIDTIIPLPQPFRQTQGQRYAIAASYPTAGPLPPNLPGSGFWRRTSVDIYPGGEPLVTTIDGGWIRQLGTDARFRTFVEAPPVPEPGTLLLVSGALVLALRKRACG